MVIFYETWKKCHEIQLTKNKMDLNKSKMKNTKANKSKIKNTKAWLELEENFPGSLLTKAANELST